jgi:phage terminase Nu1 subunit (DNA packaging protein)
MANDVKLESVSEPIFGMSPRRYRQLATEGLFPPVQNGSIDFVKSAKAVIAYYKQMAAGQGSITLTDQRARLTKINADRKQLMLERERGELVSTERAMLAWGIVTQNIDNKLSAIPRKSAPLLYGLSIQEIEAKQVQIINEVRNEVANPNLRELTGMESRKAGSPAPKSKARPKRTTVGRQKQDTISGE